MNTSTVYVVMFRMEFTGEVGVSCVCATLEAAQEVIAEMALEFPGDEHWIDYWGVTSGTQTKNR